MPFNSWELTGNPWDKELRDVLPLIEGGHGCASGSDGIYGFPFARGAQWGLGLDLDRVLGVSV